MKALKDARWKVEIDGPGFNGGFYWMLLTEDSVGIYPSDIQRSGFKTKQGAKKSWLTFAKVNRIDNWDYK